MGVWVDVKRNTASAAAQTLHMDSRAGGADASDSAAEWAVGRGILSSRRHQTAPAVRGAKEAVPTDSFDSSFGKGIACESEQTAAGVRSTAHLAAGFGIDHGLGVCGALSSQWCATSIFGADS